MSHVWIILNCNTRLICGQFSLVLAIWVKILYLLLIGVCNVCLQAKFPKAKNLKVKKDKMTIAISKNKTSQVFQDEMQKHLKFALR